ncbi:hypothetical protein H6G17_05975 [Chroococcidiopsis sp. FACHB-1243]|uniref:hypothetical protein n=1 Tax=Chroococcidiopsis sp. [FACHB-1243] TaxID=2692781 RepID=UPI00177B8A0B|nr:hypothetical protein [Chroococcidiopsis sp. [FACHB-1243]]MBD2305061.1 hypothetical protein [Chroococcidiopsis sp. [FACHB-1243]]
MPAVKRLADRAMMKEPPPEPLPFSKLEDFKDSKAISQRYCLPEPVFKEVGKQKDIDTFLSQAILDLINDSRDVVRLEEPKSKESWYKMVKKVPLQKCLTMNFKQVGGKVEHYVTTETTIIRKYIPIKRMLNVVEGMTAGTVTKQCSTFMLPTRLWNEFYRLCEYFQLTTDDSIHQAVDRAFDKIYVAPTNSNADRLKRFTEREERQQEQMVKSIAKRISKNLPQRSDEHRQPLERSPQEPA